MFSPRPEIRMELDLELPALALRVKLVLPHSTGILGLWVRSSPPLEKRKLSNAYECVTGPHILHSNVYFCTLCVIHTVKSKSQKNKTLMKIKKVKTFLKNELISHLAPLSELLMAVTMVRLLALLPGEAGI